MKKTFLILTLLCLTFVLSAQDYELYKCSRSGFRYKNDNRSWSQWAFSEVDMILRLCIKENKLEFNNNNKTVFYFNFKLLNESGVDKDNDKWTKVIWSGFDDDGLKCNLVSIDYPELTNRNFVLEYFDYEFIFECIILNPFKNTSI
ncbi:MAG: hypothetical protein UR43_C0019G0033 [candidate division TM6 bacterium GW2011_GWF2_33_332]|nr:MAG: hypothetical protein UR43_C0019G0033 [candidate division TM6 bacterium GW2011_GWF2_33_332]